MNEPDFIGENEPLTKEEETILSKYFAKKGKLKKINNSSSTSTNQSVTSS